MYIWNRAYADLVKPPKVSLKINKYYLLVWENIIITWSPVTTSTHWRQCPLPESCWETACIWKQSWEQYHTLSPGGLTGGPEHFPKSHYLISQRGGQRFKISLSHTERRTDGVRREQRIEFDKETDRNDEVSESGLVRLSTPQTGMRRGSPRKIKNAAYTCSPSFLSYHEDTAVLSSVTADGWYQIDYSTSGLWDKVNQKLCEGEKIHPLNCH